MAISAALASLIEQLRKVVFLTGLDDSVLAALARDALWRDYAAGEVVFLEGETSPGLYVLQRGWLKVLKTSPEGREQVLRFIGPGETFNEAGVFARRPNPASAPRFYSAPAERASRLRRTRAGEYGGSRG